MKLNFYPIQQVNRKITPPLPPRLIDTRQNRISHINKSTEKKPICSIFWVAENKFLTNSSSQQEYHTTLSPKTQRYETEYTISTSQQRKNPFIQSFWVDKIFFFFSIQQVNSKITPPLLSRFIETRQNMTYQQVNGEKKPYIQFFWVAKAKFLFNSTSQQPNPTPLFIKVRLHVWIQQINKPTRKEHPIHNCFYLAKYDLFWIQQVNSKITPPLFPSFTETSQD